MKRILFSALASMAFLAGALPAQAKTFGLFVHHGGRCCGGRCDFRVRPYNAFSPVCSGRITCDGCMPFQSGMPALAYGYGGYGGYDGCCVAAPGSAPTTTTTAPTAAPTLPPPIPSGVPVGGPPPLMPPTQSYNWNYGGYGVQPVGYYGYPQMMPGYPMGYGYWGPMGQVPYYWNPNGGR